MFCIGATSSASTHQISCPLVQLESTRCTCAALEEALHTLIEEEDSVQIFESDDAVLLHCRVVDTDEKICGFSDEDASIKLTKIDYDTNTISEACCCKHPRKDWSREMFGIEKDIASTEKDLTIIDLTKIQSNRTNLGGYLSFDTPGKVFHLLRSLLTCPSGIHCASPWYGSSLCSHDKAVALLVKSPKEPNECNNSRDKLEKQELDELIKFRTGDAAPSYYLHSVTKLGSNLANNIDQSEEMLRANLFHSGGGSKRTMLVFRHLPPREVLTVKEPLHIDRKCGQRSDNKVHIGCLWEKYIEVQTDTNSNDDESEKPKQTIVKHRLISPPYLSCKHEYSGILDSILNNINQIKEDAIKVPQWTAWPERNHYSSSTDDEDNPYAAWTVFPLCHTFPANDVSQRKFIETTCSFVPQTTELLKSIGPELRTALFSRLDRRTTLGTHTGWSDLANHVLRVHIPLIVPPGESCGTWVDGCVETHDEGRVIVFDDSRNHRAFCYGDGERVVLILDLERPDSLPMGTATGGHTEELDKFIQQLT